MVWKVEYLSIPSDQPYECEGLYHHMVKRSESVKSFNMYIIEGKFYHLSICYYRVSQRFYERVLN